MRQNGLSIYSKPAALLISLPFIAILVFMLRYDPTISWTAHTSDMDNQPPDWRQGSSNVARFGSWHVVFDVPDSKHDIDGSWPSFRGERGNNIQTASALPADFNSLSGVRLLWEITLGEGYAAAAVRDGKVYIIDYDENAQRDLLRCFRLSDGRELWQNGYQQPIKKNHGYSRAVPAVTENSVVSIGPSGHVMAVNNTDGSLLWGVDLASEWNSAIPSWYTAQCPLVDDGIVVVAPASDRALMIGIEESSGEIAWETPNTEQFGLSHSSIMKATIDGVPQYIYAAVGGIVSVSAKQGDKGRLLWTYKWNANVIAPSPVIMGNRIIQSAGYGSGTIFFDVSLQSGNWIVDEGIHRAPHEGLASEQQTPINAGSFIIGIQPKDAGALREQLVAADSSGTILWSSGSDLRFGLGPYLLSGDRLLLLNDDGTLYLFRVNREGYELLDSQIILPDGRDAWGPLALTETGILIARDDKRLRCYDLNGDLP
ncbi:MAG: PQQ-binding-like beta-propeller repeat protein [Spirochaetes bacterium]|nr:PQQ-binding-like beta-propeller repeat protein [Spirochaetota bacterium]